MPPPLFKGFSASLLRAAAAAAKVSRQESNGGKYPRVVLTGGIAGVAGKKSGFLLKKGWVFKGLGSVLGDLLEDLEDLGAGVVDVGVTDEVEGATVLLDSEKRRFRVPPLNMALTSSQA